ncbi:MAG: leucine-rich repeat domain-containing protein [Duncaniella sp.]|nr:leucine-rich repeat domain-containing protein [Duncaniella sp.]
MNKFFMLAIGAICTAGIAVAGSYSFDEGSGLAKSEIQLTNGTPGVAKAVTVQNINYELDNEAQTATVTGCAAGLANLNIPASITSGGKNYTVVAVGATAFSANSNITSINVPATITTVGNDAFRNLSNLKSLYINDLAAWCAIEFANGNANPLYNVYPTLTSKWGTVYVNGEAVTTLTIPEGVTSIGRAFYGFKALTSVTLPSTLKVMGDQVFANCTGLTEVVIPEGVTKMGSVFFGCTGLTSVTLPSTLTELNGNTFYGCTALASIELPESLTTMGSSVFSGCKALTSIELPAAIESIGVMAYYGCTAITEITSHATVPPTVGMFAFDDINKDIPVNVPETSLDAYKAADEWKDFTNFVGFEVAPEPANPFAPTGNEEVKGELQLLYNHTKDKPVS